MNYNAEPDQIAQLQETGKLTVIVPLKKQPPEGYADNQIYGTLCQFCKLSDDNDKIFDCWETQLQFPVGTEVGVRETWDFGYGYEDEKEYFFKDTYIAGAAKWHSSATMPDDAIRHKPVVVSCDVKRVQDITCEELYSITNTQKPIPSEHEVIRFEIKHKFKEWFNSQFAKPQPRYENGKIVGYECWAWDMKSWFKWYNNYHNTKRLRNKGFYCGNNEDNYWDNKPLTIHTEPCWVEVAELKLED